MKQGDFWFLSVVVMLSFTGCVTTNATMLGTVQRRMPLSPTAVAIYRTAAQVPGHYEEVALLNSRGPASLTNEPGMFESMKQKAAEVGANAIILDAISEPSAGAKIAGAFLGYEAERQGNSIAIYVHSATTIPSAFVQPSASIVPGETMPSVPPSPPPLQAFPSPQWTSQNPTSTAETQMRNLDREFRAGRIGIEEYRQMKKVLTGE